MSETSRKLIIIIPALNEARTIASVISSIPSKIDGISDIQTIVINDGSTDNTANTAKSAGANVISHTYNKGVGAAFHTGIETALKHGADIIVNIDADGQFNPEDITTLIQPILENKAEFVTCTRFANKDVEPKMPTIKRWGNKQMVRIVNIITGKKFTDVSCGFRAYTREAALRLTLFGKFTYTQESFIDLATKGIAIAEVPLKIRGTREFGKSRVASNLWKYGTKSASIIFRAARDYKPMYFFGLPSGIISLSGIAGFVFLLIHFIKTGQTSPYRSLVIVSGVLVIVGMLMGFMAMLADMLHRNRILTEQALYLEKKRAYDEK